MDEVIERLRQYRESALQAGGPEEIEKQHAQGKLTARERVDLLLDKGTFIETGLFVGHDFLTEQEKTFGDGIVTGWGVINKRKVALMAHDRTIHRGGVGTVGRSKYCGMLDRAMEQGVPFIGLNDAPGARFSFPRPGAPDHGHLRFSFFKRHTLASGVIPQISAILGTCAGNAVYAPALTDFIIMVDGISNMVVTGPKVIKEVTGEDVTIEQLGSVRVHCSLTGVADFRVPNEEECFRLIRRLLGFLPQNCREKAPVVPTEDPPDRVDSSIASVIPADERKTYDVRKVIKKVVDNGDFLEVKADFAKNCVIGFARMNGQSVGICANQPLFMAGTLDINSSDKQSRFIMFCNAFNIPLVFFVDNPGYLPGVHQEHGAIIRHGAKSLYAISEATVPKVAVLLRKSVGGGISGSGGDKDLGIDWMLAWPTAYRTVIGPDAAVEVLYKKEIEKAADPVEFRRQKVQELRRVMNAPYLSAAAEEVDEVIEPGETRVRLIGILEMLKNKQELRHYKRSGIPPV